MSSALPDIDVLFIAGFGPVSLNTDASSAFYVQTLGLPLKPIEGNADYLSAEAGELAGVNHFAVWPLSQAAHSCFGTEHWPSTVPTPQGWVEYEVRDLTAATHLLCDKGYHLLVANRTEPWGQQVTRLLSPEGLLTGLTFTPWLRETPAD